MKPRNFPIDIAEGTTKKVTFVFSDAPDLTNAEIVLTVKRHATDDTAVFTKGLDTTLSTGLATGSFVIKFIPADTINLDPRTYVYEVKVTTGEDTYIPLIGDLNIYNSISQ